VRNADGHGCDDFCRHVAARSPKLPLLEREVGAKSPLFLSSRPGHPHDIVAALALRSAQSPIQGAGRPLIRNFIYISPRTPSCASVVRPRCRYQSPRMIPICRDCPTLPGAAVRQTAVQGSAFQFQLSRRVFGLSGTSRRSGVSHTKLPRIGCRSGFRHASHPCW
jgi:hypothetical protein